MKGNLRFTLILFSILSLSACNRLDSPRADVSTSGQETGFSVRPLETKAADLVELPSFFGKAEDRISILSTGDRPFIFTVETLRPDVTVSFRPNNERLFELISVQLCDIVACDSAAFPVIANGEVEVDCGGISTRKDLECTFPNPGKYQIAVRGELAHLQLCMQGIGHDSFGCVYEGDLSTDCEQDYGFGREDLVFDVLSIDQWGDIRWKTMIGVAAFCEKLKITAKDAPRLDGVQSMAAAFMGSGINQPIGHWDVSAVSDMSRMFWGAEAFNQPLENWDTSNVTTMAQMFWRSDFNQPLENWDTSKVTDMHRMFRESPFDQPLEKWNTANVTTMAEMFRGSAFRQPLEKWNTSKVKHMRGMFMASPYNQPLAKWDVSSVTDMSEMFRESYYNQPLDGWNTSNVVRMDKMFKKAVFNRSIGSWDTSNVKDMCEMFYLNVQFNQPIGDWDVSEVKSMKSMFRNAESFDQPLENWDTSSVENMSFMFYSAESFNQPLGNWTVSKTTDLYAMPSDAKCFRESLRIWHKKYGIDKDAFEKFPGVMGDDSWMVDQCF